MTMRVNFYLDKPKKAESMIKMAVSLKGRDFVYLPETVETRYWNSKEQRLKEIKGMDDHERINNRLDGYLREAKKIYNKYRDNDEHPTFLEIIEYLEEKINNRKPVAKSTGFFAFVESFIEQQKSIKQTDGKHGTYVTTLIQTKRILEAYEKDKHIKLTYNNMDLGFYADFIDWMAQVKDYTVNTAGGHVKRLRKFLRLSFKAKLHNKEHYLEFKKMEKDPDVIALSWDEIDKIAKVDLSGTGLQAQRDLFVVGCYTGLRYSDFGFLKPQNFIDGFIHKKMQKAQRQVIIPIHKKLLPILERYKYKLPDASAISNINLAVKSIGLKAELKDIVYWTENRLKGEIAHESPKYELITTHTARRSFATNMYKDGVPVRILMKITGHKTEKDFFKYIRMTPMDEAKMLKAHMDIIS